MGISGGLFLITLGALLAFAIQVDPWWIDLQATGVIVMLAGGAVIVVTLWYWQERRRSATAAPQTRIPPDAQPPGGPGS